MITYNHEKFIREAIESVLMQKTNFDYELVIGEDCSTDTTRQVCLDYQQKYPNKIKLLLPEKNLGMMPNFIATLKACQGKYIALCEGDDYWTDENKLQKQVDFLETNTEYVICFHNSLELFETNPSKIFYYCSKNQKQVSTLVDLLYRNYIPTCSVIFKNNLFENFPSWFNKLGMGDWSLHIINAQYGKIKYITEVMGVHRVHEGGVWSRRKQSQNLLDMLKAYDVFDKYLGFKHHKDIQNYKFNYLNSLYMEYISEKQKIKSIGVLFKQVSIWHRFLVKREFYQKLRQILLS